MRQKFKTGVLTATIGALLLPLASQAADGEHKLDIAVRGVYFNDKSTAYPTSSVPNPVPSSYEQSALGVQLNYQSPYWAGFIGVDASLYGVAKIGDSGKPTTNMVELGNNGQLDEGYATLGQAAIKLKYADYAVAKIGRQIQSSLLLKSSYTRAVPDTYWGISGAVTPTKAVKIYGAIYDQWRARSNDEFENFRTEATANNVANKIDYISLIGATYREGPIAVTAEYLNSKSYLSKFGLVGAYTIPLGKNSLKLSSGLFTSRDAGSLFVCSAEKEVDCTGTGRIDNNGMGVYIDAEWKVSNFTIGGAIAKFDGLWIEDNFAANASKDGSLNQDHGTNPFPTSAALGPDLANNDEFVTSVRIAYDWKDYIKGLKTSFKYSRGTGAHSSNRSNNAEGSENFREFDVRYALPFVKNVSMRYVYYNYDSHIDGGSTSATIKGMTRQDWDQHRFYIDYVYSF